MLGKSESMDIIILCLVLLFFPTASLAPVYKHHWTKFYFLKISMAVRLQIGHKNVFKIYIHCHM